jgi:hypothetical protein
MDEPTAFLSLETLRSLAGQVMVVMMVTQAVKSAAPRLNVYFLRMAAVLTGIAVHGALVWQAGMPPAAYLLALANGTLVALSAMKSSEMLKGERPATPPAA